MAKHKPLNHQAKEALALAFEGIGGLPALITWAKNHRNTFYEVIYPKLIPVTLAGTVDLTANEDNTAHAALETILHGLIAERDNPTPIPSMKVSNDGAGLIIDVVANPPAPPPPPAPEPNAEDRASETVVHIRRVAEQPPPVHPVPPSATELFYEWHNAGGNKQMWWGPVGSGGRPP